MAQDLGLITGPVKLRTVRGYAMPATGFRRRGEGGVDVAWPSGTVGQIVFAGGATWTATLDGPRMLWTATSAQVEAQPSGTKFRVVIDGVPYFVGEVVRDG